MGRGLRHRPDRARQSCCRRWKWEQQELSTHAALTAGTGCPGPCSKETWSHLHQSSLIQEELSLPPPKNIDTDQPRKRSWGLSGAGVGHVPQVSPQQQACSPPSRSLRLQSCVLPGCTHSGTVKPLSRSPSLAALTGHCHQC